MTEIDSSRPRDRWRDLLSFSATAIGIAFYLGYKTLEVALNRRYRFEGSPLALFSYDELLMRGIEVILDWVVPKMVLAFMLAYFIQKTLPRRIRWVCAWIVTIVVAYCALATPMPRIRSPLLFVVSTYPDIFAKFLIVVLAIAVLEYLDGNFLFTKQKPSLGVLVAGIIFIVWTLPFLAAPDFSDFPRTTVTFNDGRIIKGELLSQKDGLLIIGRSEIHAYQMVPISSIAQFTVP